MTSKPKKQLQKIFDEWQDGTMEFAYSSDTRPALECLLRDIARKDIFWFNSDDLDKFMKKFLKKVLA